MESVYSSIYVWPSNSIGGLMAEIKVVYDCTKTIEKILKIDDKYYDILKEHLMILIYL